MLCFIWCSTTPLLLGCKISKFFTWRVRQAHLHLARAVVSPGNLHFVGLSNAEADVAIMAVEGAFLGMGFHALKACETPAGQLGIRKPRPTGLVLTQIFCQLSRGDTKALFGWLTPLEKW